MEHKEQWIWLPEQQYPGFQTIHYNRYTKEKKDNFSVAEFKRQYAFEKTPVRVKLRFSGDTLFQLYCNEKLVATGPACVGGDFIGNNTPRDNFYAFETELDPHSCTLDFFARVRMMPVLSCDYSKGHGGFMLSAIAEFADGTRQQLCTDESWLVRRNGAYNGPVSFDGRIGADEYVNAQVTENIWHTQTAPIPIRAEEELLADGHVLTLQGGEELETVLEFDRIYAGFLQVKAEARGVVSMKFILSELESDGKSETVIFDGDGTYRGFLMHSAGNIRVFAKNESGHPAKVTVSFLSTHYPVTEEAFTQTSDEDLNRVLDVCKHTLKICRQTHHIDSPRHCEPTADTGDAYIESLMTLFSFGDMRLAKFDLKRMALMLERENGRMFHTAYSLIFVRMLQDVYEITGDISLLQECEKGLDLLLARFEGYMGENGLLEKTPDYMFIDWIYLDELSLHHPPKALGQTCMNMFYFGALDAAEKIYGTLSRHEAACSCRNKREDLRQAINSLLYDETRGMYFAGLNTPTEESLLANWMPQNTTKRYYIKHPNILAAYVGVCDDATARALIRKIMTGEIEGDCQPYFTHYLLEAVCRLGLRETYTLQILDRWKGPAKQCPKGLVEGFVLPEPTYSFDHSHAWGGSPLYSLPKALMGLEILAPGMTKLRLDPSLLGLEQASTELLTPYGKVTLTMRRGAAPQITWPDEIDLLLAGQ